MTISRKKHGTGSAVSRSRDLTRRGVSREKIRRLAAKGDIERAGRGVYLTSLASRSPHRDLLVVSARAPNAVVCLLSALAFHGLTTEMPHEIWIAVGLKARTPAIDTPPIRVVRMSDAPLSAGIETHLELEVPIRIYSPAKTVADCFKFRSKVSVEVALAALRDGWRQKRFTLDELWHFARILPRRRRHASLPRGARRMKRAVTNGLIERSIHSKLKGPAPSEALVSC